MHSGLAIISKEKLNDQYLIEDYFDRNNLYNYFDYFEIGGGWSNIFNENNEQEKTNLERNIIQIKDDNIEKIKNILKESFQYIVDYGYLISKSKIIENPNYNPEIFKNISNTDFMNWIHKINSLSPEEQNKLPLEDWENIRDVSNLQFYNFIDKELKNYIDCYITVLDVHE